MILPLGISLKSIADPLTHEAIAKLEAENGELKQALAESEKRCAILEYRLSRSKNNFSLSNAEE